MGTKFRPITNIDNTNRMLLLFGHMIPQTFADVSIFFENRLFVDFADVIIFSID